jgi:hypothetical protein
MLEVTDKYNGHRGVRWGWPLTHASNIIDEAAGDQETMTILKASTRQSPHFTPVSLEGAFNARRSDLSERLRTPGGFIDRYGEQTVLGIPFLFGEANGANVVVLDGDSASLPLDGAKATYVLFVHAVEDDEDVDRRRMSAAYGNRLGGLVSEYELEFEDGSVESVPIHRRLAIGQGRGHSSIGGFPLACVPAAADRVILATDEYLALRELPPASPWGGLAETRVLSAPVVAAMENLRDPGLLWIYALKNPKPELSLRAAVCRPREERSTIYAVSLTDVVEHPLRSGGRRKLRIMLPDRVGLNAIGEVDEAEIGIDLGVVISARAALDYDRERWLGDEPVVEPVRSEREVIVEYAAHPQARLYVVDEAYELGSTNGAAIVDVATAERPVRLRFVDRDSGSAVAVRLHLHGEGGEYLPPRGHHRKVNRVWHQDNSAEFATVENQYAYVDGDCVADLPLGTVYVEITRGYEIAPVRTSVEIRPETDELVFELERVLGWREEGWVTADTHVHFLSPKTALLEGQAEGVNVVNLLATQWGEMFTNVGDFDGSTTFGAKEFGGDGEFLVRVGSENRISPLGHISLLGYKGELIHPLCTSGPDESALGDPLETTIAEWARRCIDRGGLVVLPHAQLRSIEHAADVVLGVVNALELMCMNPLIDKVSHPDFGDVEMPPPLDPYGIAGWYRYLNLGYQIPLTGGSDKMAASALLGGIRCYAHLGDREFTYDNWLEAIRQGNTFVTVGPLVALTVEGVAPGGQVRLPVGGGTVQVEWLVESLRVPIEAVEIVVGGLIESSVSVGGKLSAEGHTAVRVPASSWVALRVRGSYHGKVDDVAAHTSAVQVLVDGSELFSEPDAIDLLDQIQGAIAYVDTIAPRAEARRFRELRSTLETAYNGLHERMHAAGIYHRQPLHDPARPHEH